MKKATSLILSAVVVGSLGLTSFTTTAFADERQGYGKRGEQSGKFQKRGGPARGSFIHLMCSEDGAARLEQMLNRGGDRITLSDEQQALYDTFKTQALAAQTQYSDSCTTPTRSADADVVDRMKVRQDNMKALVAAMDTVMPAFEAFHDSLSDEQKAEMKPKRGKGGKFGRDGDRRGGPRSGSNS